ncbi:MAG: tetratricopeptide repeat protein, partial [Runella zeae]
TSGYYLSSLISLGKIAENEKDFTAALEYYKTVVDRGEKKSSQVKEAKEAISKLNKTRREERRKRRD